MVNITMIVYPAIKKTTYSVCTFVFNRAGILVQIIAFCREVSNLTELKLVTDLRVFRRLVGRQTFCFHARREGISRVCQLRP